ncbi:MAG: SGNH/GDSL hydrolase family protein [Alphaproteobacteria bacterium]|nr:SGNH/GDSL hydrolase family protein [Alphaproteobacteria bacterium]
MSYKVIAALGDSVTNGYWDETFSGWFGRLASKISAAHSKSFGFHNLSQDGDRISDFFHRFASEGLSREIDILIITVSGNDLIRSPEPDSPQDLSEHLRNEYWHKLLDLAQKNIPQIIVMDALPRHKDNTIAYGWFDAPMHEPNSDRIEYNNQIAQICKNRGIPFFRRYDKWVERDLSKYYVDTAHPNGDGHQLIANELYDELEKLGVFDEK